MKTTQFPWKTILAIAALAAVAACDRNPPPGPQTFETEGVRAALASFKSNPSESNKQAVELALSKMDSEIKELEVRSGKVSGAEKAENDRKAAELREKSLAFRSDFTAAKAEATLKKAGQAATEAVKDAGEAVKSAAQSVGEKIDGDKKD